MLKAPRFWYQKRSFYAYLLSPFSLLYRLVIWCRYQCYRLGLKKGWYFPVPIIIVGNITVGGTGKTPLVIWLANWLKTQGFQPGIVSRGYRSKKNKKPVLVNRNLAIDDVGDEALLLHERTECPVVIARERPKAVKSLIEHSHCNIIISDDGLQHLALARDIEIVVMDGSRQMGNGYCLPAGPLREPINRLNQVDYLVVNNPIEKNMEYFFRTQIKTIYQIKHPDIKVSISEFSGKTVHALAGIGNPNKFFKTLTDQGIEVITHAFPDHHHYQRSDIYFSDQLPILMTEKDAVKCRDWVDERHWCVAIDIDVSVTLLAAIKSQLAQLNIFNKS